jgi:polygalacturonase
VLDVPFIRAKKTIAAWLILLVAFTFCGCLTIGAKSTPPALPAIPAHSVNLTDFGAVGDGVTLNTSAFAKAFAALTERGGGRLIVPPGIWVTGPIKLASHVDLHLEIGALIKFSGDYNLYPLIVVDLRGEKEVDSTSPIMGENLEDVSITGNGIIDGGGDAWRPIKKSKLLEDEWKNLVKSGGVLSDRGDTWYPSREVMTGERLVSVLRKKESLKVEDYEPAHQYLRPKMLRLIGCKKVLLQDFTIQNPPNWTMNPVLCDDVSILNVQVRNAPTAQNSDALDLESCRHAVIRNCIFDAGDDGICIKSGKDAAGRRIGVPTEDVLVEGCTVYHAHGGFTIGSEMSGGVRDMRVTNCTFLGTDVGLRFKSTRGRGGVVERIDISNIRMVGITGDAINFNLYYGGQSVLEQSSGKGDGNSLTVNEGTPQFRDIHIENIVCRGARKAIVLQGLPEMPVRNITLKNVDISAQEGVFVTDGDNISFDHVRVENKSGAPLTEVRVKNSRLELAK